MPSQQDRVQMLLSSAQRVVAGISNSRKCMESSSGWEGWSEHLSLFEDWNNHVASVLCMGLSWQTVTALLAIPVLPVGAFKKRNVFTYIARQWVVWVSAWMVLFECCSDVGRWRNRAPLGQIARPRTCKKLGIRSQISWDLCGALLA